jgi:DNA-directed RNA polymerase subunit RPC12/RpoP
MPLTVTCPNCSKTGSVPSSYAGRDVRCPSCSARIHVPPVASSMLVPARRRVVTVPTPVPAPAPAAAPFPVATPVRTVPCPACGELLAPGVVRCWSCGQDQVQALDEPVAVPCPFCAEDIRPGAKLCRSCGEALDPVLRAAQEARRIPAAPQAAAAVHVQQNVNVYGPWQGFPRHSGHALLTVLTCGLWSPIWFIDYLCWSSAHPRP